MKISLGRKIVILIISVALILSGTCIVVSDITNRNTMEKEYKVTADSLANTVAVAIDGDILEKVTEKVITIYKSTDNKISNEQCDDPQFETYSAKYKHIMNDDDYISVQKSLRKLQDISEADCVYTLFVDQEDRNAVYIVDAAYNDEFIPPGCFDPIDPSCYPYMNNPSMGLPAYVTNTDEYGWIVTSCAPVYNSRKEIVCFAAVDLNMNDILTKENHFLIILTLILSLLTVIICIFAIIYVKYRIVNPINMLSSAAGQYRQKHLQDHPHKEFSSLKINTGDELEILLNSMIQMENDIDNYISNLSQTREQLSSARQQADNMHELAYMDALTGIRNKLAYDKEMSRLEKGIQLGSKNFGIAMIDLNFLKLINDNYGHECGNEAIKRLSSMICNIFVHSPVFRIGGDEFVVILRNHDYYHIEELSEEFNKQIESFAEDTSLKPWEKTSAALGYALFDTETDDSAEDVFKRADQQMYERKKAMKAMRK